jgi:hypothetical protein
VNVERAKAGSAGAVNELYERCAARLLAYITSRTSRGSTADP